MKERFKELGYWLEDRLKGLCGEITPDKRLTIILSMLLLFTIGNLYFTISSIYNWGRDAERKEQLKIEHIRRLELERDKIESHGFIDSPVDHELFEMYKQGIEPDPAGKIKK
jgi:hypothetical protein